MIDLRKLVEPSDKSLLVGGNPPVISLVFAMVCGYWFPSVFNSNLRYPKPVAGGTPDLL